MRKRGFALPGLALLLAALPSAPAVLLAVPAMLLATPALLLATPAAGQIPPGTARMNGEVVSFPPGGIRLRSGDRGLDTVALAADWSVVLGQPIERRDLRAGDALAVNAHPVATPSGPLLIAHSIITVCRDPLVADPDGLARLFQDEPDRNSALHPSDSVLVWGRVTAVGATTVDVERDGVPMRIELGLTGAGYLLQPADRSTLRLGDQVFAPISSSRARAILVLPRPLRRD